MPFLQTEAPGLEEVEWLNSSPGSLESGTYLLNFWKSSCLRCIDVLEAINRVHRDHPGIEAVAVHVPELGVGREAAESLIRDAGIDHHVGHDQDGRTAEVYGARDPSRMFLVHGGELVWQKTPGNTYRELEEKVEDLTGKSIDLETGTEASPDRYLGHSYGELVNDGVNFRGEKGLSAPGNMVFERVYLDGSWRRKSDHLESLGGELYIHQKSSRAGAVMDADSMTDVEVRIDGEPVPHSLAGDDLRVENGRSYVRVNKRRMYSLVSGQGRRYELDLKPEKGSRIYKLSFR